ncbi:MAG: hypothetical protein IJE28_06215 [Oscillospiraceae bacterium]|nr:hypothetical protein [Oscillospiraceae bacterium]MBQ4546363.1 hypothetical protein [Oscillospiraceae bacterium]
MKKTALIILAALFVCAFAGCSHEHVPGPSATCLEPQICTECGEILVEATGHRPGDEATCASAQLCVFCGIELAPKLEHTPGAEATCTEPQLCESCGTELAPALGHTINSENACDTCSLQIVPAGQKYIKPGRNGALSDNLDDIVPETESGHYNNNVDAYYVGATLVCGDYAMEYFLPSEGGNAGWASLINKFAEKYPDISVNALLVPKNCAFNAPAGYTDPFDRTKAHIDATYAMLNDGIKAADIFGIMTEHRDEYLFYRTDHHWTSLGAYYASVAFCNANDIVPYALDTYETVVKTGFLGTFYGWAGKPASLKENPDYTVAHYPHTGYSMIAGNSGNWYNTSALNYNYNNYAGMFISGDNPLTVITTANKNGRTLMIFKESYGNAFVPYMIDYFEQIVVVDIREETKGTGALIEQYGVTDVIFINNCQAAITFEQVLKAKALS